MLPNGVACQDGRRCLSTALCPGRQVMKMPPEERHARSPWHLEKEGGPAGRKVQAVGSGVLVSLQHRREAAAFNARQAVSCGQTVPVRETRID